MKNLEKSATLSTQGRGRNNRKPKKPKGQSRMNNPQTTRLLLQFKANNEIKKTKAKDVDGNIIFPGIEQAQDDNKINKKKIKKNKCKLLNSSFLTLFYLNNCYVNMQMRLQMVA